MHFLIPIYLISIIYNLCTYLPSLPRFDCYSPLSNYRPGSIAGVCNPAFADRPSWWDVLCNIETGKIIISKDISLPSPTSPTRLIPRSPHNNGIDNIVASFSDIEIENNNSNTKVESPDNAFLEDVSGPHFLVSAMFNSSHEIFIQ